jgi:DNA-3-methyladenine glycosylase II
VAGLQALDDAALRGVGLSSQKLGYMRDLCGRIADGRLRLDELDELTDEQIIERLTAVKGFGRWTAEMFLMFRLQRPDVLPVADLGICTAVQRIYRLRQRPKPQRLTQIGEAWRPYRSVACWYLWESLKKSELGSQKSESSKKTERRRKKR